MLEIHVVASCLSNAEAGNCIDHLWMFTQRVRPHPLSKLITLFRRKRQHAIFISVTCNKQKHKFWKLVNCHSKYPSSATYLDLMHSYTLFKFCTVQLLQMEKGDKRSTLIRMGVSGWMFLLVPAYPGCFGSKAVKRSLLLLLLFMKLQLLFWSLSENVILQR